MKKTIAAVILLPFLAVMVSGSVFSEKEQDKKVLNRAVVRIDKLSCSGCFPTIRAGLENLEGYSGMGTNLFRKLIAVDFAEPLTRDKISQKLSEIGYPAEVQYVDAISEKESFAFLESKRGGYGGLGGGCCNPGSGGSCPVQSVRSQPAAGASCCTLPGGSASEKGKSL